MEHMMLQLQRTADQEAAVKAFIDQQQDSSSPNFHKWLTAEEFGARFGSDPQDIATVKRWLQSSGFTVESVYPNGMTIDFSGNAGNIYNAFHTEIHKLTVAGQQHYANMSDPQIPEALAPAVLGVTSMHDFHAHPLVKAKKEYTTSQSGTPFQIVTPADMQTIYDLQAAFTAGYTGQGQTIAVAEDSDLYRASDWSTFRSTFGLASYTGGTLTTTHPAPASGRNNCLDPGVTGDDIEAITDVEWASAAAPNAAIVNASCSSATTDGVLLAVQNLVSAATPPQIISVSYGSCEAANGAAYNASYNTAFQTGVTRGISFFVSSGDSGPADCDGLLGQFTATHGLSVSALSSTPYNVSVGGTDFADTYQNKVKTYWSQTNSAVYGSAISYIPEIPWNDSCAGALLTKYAGFHTAYGANGFCGSDTAASNGLINAQGGGGGASSCATGTPTYDYITGGSCQGYAKPSWQTGVTGIPADGVRDTPDVSLFAATGLWYHYYVTCFTDASNGGAPCTGDPVNWAGGGGTSFAAPIMAGIQALVNQKVGGAQGNPAPVLYKLAASSASSQVFHTINLGDTAVNCAGAINCYGAGFEGRGRASAGTQFIGNGALSTTTASYTPAFSANGAWSFATGIGSVDAFNLIMNWSLGQ
jgi:subtilase family serine protease